MAACHVFDVPRTRLIGTRGVKMLKSWPPNTQIVSPAGVLEGTWTWMAMVAVGGWVCASSKTAAKPMMMYINPLIGADFYPRSRYVNLRYLLHGFPSVIESLIPRQVLP